MPCWYRWPHSTTRGLLRIPRTPTGPRAHVREHWPRHCHLHQQHVPPVDNLAAEPGPGLALQEQTELGLAVCAHKLERLLTIACFALLRDVSIASRSDKLPDGLGNDRGMRLVRYQVLVRRAVHDVVHTIGRQGW